MGSPGAWSRRDACQRLSLSASSTMTKARKTQETAATATTRYSVRSESSGSAEVLMLPRSAKMSGMLSATATVSVTVAERGGWPWSCTATTRLCLSASLSSRARAVRTSPVCSPTSKSPGSLSPGSLACSTWYDSQALCPESASTATTLVTR
uniref:Uncharacterized protein n=1 Tax=Canis lupus dingo TaxID=286419 RepID=A0A8C0R543_CANLU